MQMREWPFSLRYFKRQYEFSDRGLCLSGRIEQTVMIKRAKGQAEILVILDVAIASSYKNSRLISRTTTNKLPLILTSLFCKQTAEALDWSPAVEK